LEDWVGGIVKKIVKTDVVARAEDTVHDEAYAAVLYVYEYGVGEQFSTASGVNPFNAIQPSHGCIGIVKNERSGSETQAVRTRENKVGDVWCSIIKNDAVAYTIKCVHIELDVRGFGVVAEIAV
jgi:hypothetical protein